MMLPMVLSPILILAYQKSFDLGRFITLRYSGPLSFIPSGRLDNQSLKRRTGSVFPPSVKYIACGVVLRDIVRPPLRVLVGPSRNSTTSLPSSCLRSPLRRRHSAPGDLYTQVAQSSF